MINCALFFGSLFLGGVLGVLSLKLYKYIRHRRAERVDIDQMRNS